MSEQGKGDERKKKSMALKSQNCHHFIMKTMKTTFFRFQYFRKFGVCFLKLEMKMLNQTCFSWHFLFFVKMETENK